MTGEQLSRGPLSGGLLSGGLFSGSLFSGIALVARQEFRVRLRSGRWRWLLATWVVVIALFTTLLSMALLTTGAKPGVPLFGGLMLFVLALMLIISPAFTAQSINGDRERGTLATLQVTRLSPAQIALGKLVAGWAVGLVALALTLPFVGWSLVQTEVGVLRAVVVLAVVALLIGVVCAVSQGMSAVVSRSITSALLSYLVVFALTAGTLIAFGMSLALTADTVQRRSFDGEMYQATVARPDRVWWLLAPNPFIVLADAAPRLPARRDPATGNVLPEPFDPLGAVGREARRLREPVDPLAPDSGVSVETSTDSRPVWPYGLGFDLLLGVGAVWVSVRRLQAPARTLAKGVRVA